MDKAQVEVLRRRSGAGLMECKKALQKANGDLLLAEGYMKYSGLAVNIKMAGKNPEEAKEDWVWSKARTYAESMRHRDGA